MDLQIIKDKAAAILGAGSDQGIISPILAEIVDAFTLMTAEVIQSRQQLDQQLAENENLRKANMDLFLKIPVSASDSKPEPDPEPEVPSFDALFANGKLL